MIRAAAILLLLAGPAAAAPCYDLGHVGNCPLLGVIMMGNGAPHRHPHAERFRSNRGVACCSTREVSLGIRGSGSISGGRGGYLGKCGASPVGEDGHCQ